MDGKTAPPAVLHCRSHVGYPASGRIQNVVADALSRPLEAAQESPPTSPSWDSRGGKAKMKMSTSSGGLSSGPVVGERGAAVAAVAAGSTAAVWRPASAAARRRRRRRIRR